MSSEIKAPSNKTNNIVEAEKDDAKPMSKSPYIDIVSKKIRSLKKKLAHIIKLRDTVPAEKYTVEQKSLVVAENFNFLPKMIEELERIQHQMQVVYDAENATKIVVVEKPKKKKKNKKTDSENKAEFITPMLQNITLTSNNESKMESVKETNSNDKVNTIQTTKPITLEETSQPSETTSNSPPVINNTTESAPVVPSSSQNNTTNTEKSNNSKFKNKPKPQTNESSNSGRGRGRGRGHWQARRGS